ncbi:putative DNA-binding protein [Aerococcus sanguinicola]|uniref:putative DNA-binding protein n=1 Tax=unclassified Aerococcus TaxID=2618060 RepID=UPI0008A3A912|nr:MULTISPECIES: putative DNA-binding protein [unclassified Aerococcus]KAB0647689.1 putative DNA-binding protein [Aerococcus sanguinicola]MDK6233071.1 putative DNA-binding protein [Aerococcus sp. UMB10185]MDK6804484.1 putative DNA-binding protein [Aerococcus sp. UMB7834]MDK6855366.1 putative DNA-binding protein [Aerococcus sp. UMB7533]MDK8502944.1 putative DNA-binding protein [Aerococcus sp. UMB1112A]
MELEKTNEMNRLYDFYGDLLTAKQQAYMALYYQDDYSLGEIAEAYDVSRQAVYDNIRRTEKILQHYEAVLHNVKAYRQRKRLGQKVQSYIDSQYPEDQVLHEMLAELMLLNDEIDD